MSTAETKAADFIVGIGASAGGLKAFEALLPGLPQIPNAAYILLQHLDATHSSSLCELLSMHTQMPVSEIGNGMFLEGGRVYVCPPGKSCTISNNRLRLKKYVLQGPRHSIDILFSSIARHSLSNCAGIVLSGLGNDGLLGSREIKAGGGWILVQDPATADFRDMPEALISHFLADFVRPAQDMGAELEEILRLALLRSHDMALANDAEKMQMLLELLENETGFNFHRYREAMLHRRITRRLQANKLDSLGEYLMLVKKSRAEAQCLIKDIFITVTGFFRDRKVFQHIDLLLGEMIGHNERATAIRIWSAGCATGEEAYSFAMLLARHTEKLVDAPTIEIFATDIDPDNIAFARKGLYSAKAVENVPRALLSQYFDKTEAGYQISKQLREMVVFAVHDAALDAPFSRLDLICCRNVLIYFNPQTQNRMIRRFHYALKPEGYLLLGSSENVGKSGQLFNVEDRQKKLYRRLDAKTAGASFALVEATVRTGKKEPPAAPSANSRQSQIPRLQQLRDLYFNEYVPAAVLVNSKLEILYLHGNVAPYLSLPGGDIRFELLGMVLPELHADLHLILQLAQRKGITARSRPLHIKLPDSSGTRIPGIVTLVAIPQSAAGNEGRNNGEILLVFEHKRVLLTEDRKEDENSGQNARDLEEELVVTREQLEASMAALEGAGQELQSVTEEFQSTTEELQTTNEEFQTINEELESTNEELHSVNDELKSKSLILEQTNAELDLILNSTLAGIIVMNADLQVVRSSASCRKLFKFWPEEVSSIQQLISKLDGMAAITPHIQTALKSGLPSQLELELEKRFFTLRLIPVTASYTTDPSSLIVAFYDETERMQKETESKLLAAIVRNSEDAIIVHDLNGAILNWNTGAAHLFGYSEREALSKNINTLIETDKHGEYQSYIKRLLKGSTGNALETRGVTRQGRHPDLWLNASTLLDMHHKPSAIAANFRDITEKKSIENKLVALVESTPDPFIIVEASGIIQRVNKQAEKLFGYGRQEMVGKSFKMLVPERFRSQHDVFTRNYQVKPVMRQMGGGLELWCLTKSGQEIPVEISLSPVVSPDETTIMVRFRDVREQKKAQTLLTQSRQKADEANRTKSRFLAAASHDLRQPLQSISMSLGVLAEDISHAQKTRVIDKARMALDTTNKLLNSLLNITKLEAGKVQPEIATFNIRDVLERVHNTESQQAMEKAQKFSLRSSSAVVTSDPALLEQLLTNLVANAIKYTPPHGHILVGCRRLQSHIKVQVADNGPGIASEALDLIFDEYRQLDYGGHYEGRGLGLGLSIVKLLADLLHLKLEVRSTPGKGSSFSVLVPLAQGKAKPAPQMTILPVARKKLTKNLLLIDDDAAVLDSTSFFLSISGFKVQIAKNSVEAMAAVAALTPDLIITDYGLAQQETGIELLARLRASMNRDVPAIVITGDTSVQRKQGEKMADGAKGANFEIICKPIDAQVLLQLVLKQFAE